MKKIGIAIAVGQENMIVKESLIEELQKIIKKEHGLDLTLHEVAEIGNNLVGYFDLLGKIYHQDHDNLSKP